MTANIRQIPYKTLFEVRSTNVPALNRALNGTGWTATPSPDDCSHTSENCRAVGSYTHIAGPQTTLDGGGAATLATVLGKVQQVVPDHGSTAAMRILVPDSYLDGPAVTRLANFHLAYETILYSLGASGGPGRPLADKMTWSCPLSKGSNYISNEQRTRLFSPHTAPQLRTALANKHWGMNASVPGWWEFRYFDTSYNAAGMQASHDLVLSMVGAAANNSLRADTVRPLDVSKAVAAGEWNSFMAVVAPEGVLRDQLRANLVASGATLVGAGAAEALAGVAPAATDTEPARGLGGWWRRLVTRVTG